MQHATFRMLQAEFGNEFAPNARRGRSLYAT